MASGPAQSAIGDSGAQLQTGGPPSTTASTSNPSASAATGANGVGNTISTPAGNTILNAPSASTTTGTNGIGNTAATSSNPSASTTTGTNGIGNAASAPSGGSVNTTSNTPSASTTTGPNGPNGIGNAASTPASSPPNTTSSNLSVSATAGTNGIGNAASTSSNPPVSATTGTNGIGNAASPPANVFSHTAAEIRRLNTLTKSEEIYNEAVRRVLAAGSGEGLSEEEIQLITSKGDAESFQQDIQNEIAKTPMWNRQGKLWFRGTKATLNALQRFGTSIDIMVQANPTIAGLAWGGFRSLMIIAKEVFDTYDRLVELAEQTQFTLKRFKKHMDRAGIEPIKEELLSFHTKMIEFCLLARKVYKRRSWKTCIVIFRSSLEAPFGELLKSITRAAEEVEKSATAEHMTRSEDLMQRMLRKGNQTLLPTQPPERLYLVQIRPTQHFTGRENVLERLRLSFTANRIPDRPHTAALFGLPGVGKSQTAIRYAEESQPSHPYTFFVRSESEENLLSDFRKIAYRLKILDESSDLKDSIYIEKIFEWLENTPNWLIIFDNVIDLPTIQKWIPRSGTGNILYTTRNPVLAENLVEETSRAFEVQPLEIGQAIELTNRLRNERNPHEEIEKLTRQLCEDLGCLPIAINQATELARFHNMSLVTLLKNLRRKRDVLDQQHTTSRHESNMSVWALYLLTMEAVELKTPQAAALMKTLIYFDTTSIPIEFIKEGASKLDDHLNRDVIYPRGTIHDNPAQALKTLQKAKVTEAPVPLTLLGWRISLPTRASPSSTPEPSSLPLSTSDIGLSTFYRSNKPLHDLLASPTLIDNAIPPLRAAGLLRLNGDGTIWIHDLVRAILLEHIAETSPLARDSRAHLSLTMVYLSFPEPPLPLHYSAIYDRCLSHQPHALATLHHCSRFVSDCTIGPELMHMVASFFHIRDQREHRSWLDEAVKYYTLAFTGYFAAWKRQRLHLHPSLNPPSPSMTSADTSIVLDERKAYAVEAYYGRDLAYARTTDQYERFGGPARRLFDTALKLAFILSSTNPLLAIPWASKATQGYSILLGASHDLTFSAMGLEVQLYMRTQQWDAGLHVVQRRYDASEIRSGPPTANAEGAQCCAEVGFMLEGLHQYEEAIRWFGYALSGREAACGADSIELAGTVLTIGILHEKLHHHQEGIDMFVRSRTLCEEWGSELGSSQARVELATSLLRVGRGAEALVELRWVCAYLRRIHHGSFEETYHLTRPIWLKCAWNFGLARLVIGDGTNIPSDFGGGRLDEAEVLFGKVELCNGCSLP